MEKLQKKMNIQKLPLQTIATIIAKQTMYSDPGSSEIVEWRQIFLYLGSVRIINITKIW